MAKMRVVQVPEAKAPFEMVEREVPEPVSGAVRIKVQGCGICHSDSYTKDGLVPGIQYPRVPGHEVIGLSVPTCRDGPRDSGSVWVGMGEIAVTATRVGAATPSPARPRAWLQASLPMEDMPITWLPGRKRWRAFRRICRTSMPHL